MRTVLIVGDVHLLPDVENTMLGRSEVVLLATTPGRAPELAAERQADLALVDARGLGGAAAVLCDALRRRRGAGLRVLLVAAPAEQARHAASGADGFVSRPLTTARLLDALRRHAPLAERAEARIPFAVKAEYVHAGSAASGYLHDLTSGGLFLVAREPLAPGDEIEVTFALPHAEPHPIHARARVVRAGQAGPPGHGVAGFGLAFVDLRGARHIDIARWLRGKGAA